MVGRLRSFVTKLLSYEQCAHRFALSACMGIYIAFSPFFGFHTALVFLFSWLFALNCAIVLTVSMVVNNPWTMLPVYGSGYMFGDRLLRIFGITHHDNPTWMESCNSMIYHYTGLSGISFWGFLIGGNILGIILSIIAYPLFKRYAIVLKNKSTQTAKQTFVAAKKVVNKAKNKIRRSPDNRASYENSRSK